jgi:N-methylhydantoinase A
VEGRIPSPLSDQSSHARNAPGQLADAQLGEREVAFDGEPQLARVYRGEALPPGAAVEGPAILEYFGTTAVVARGQRATADADGNVVIDCAATRSATSASARQTGKELPR